MITRIQVTNALKQALEPLGYVNAMWEAGAASFNRVDEWSDIDLAVDVADDKVEESFTAIEDALNKLTGIELTLVMPSNMWHGFEQKFYRLKNASPFLLVDLSIIKCSNPNKFLEKEIHGTPIIHFDKQHIITPHAFDLEAHKEKLRLRLDELRLKFDIFQPLVEKELNRKNHIEAIMFYLSWTLNPLLELLRTKHNVYHYNFGVRYVHYELPAEDIAKLEPLYYIKSGEELRTTWEKAKQLFNEEWEAANAKRQATTS
jgi:predicted nucleotidyltransferase